MATLCEVEVAKGSDGAPSDGKVQMVPVGGSDNLGTKVKGGAGERRLREWGLKIWLLLRKIVHPIFVASKEGRSESLKRGWKVRSVPVTAPWASREPTVYKPRYAGDVCILQ